ncbi:glycosyltransferase family 39 protein [Fluviicola sp.]|uniref:glycosyltransferase family 39 protein n=1 Tax=Fluviicola sp. TaxID=1917219 RepID=UPI0031D847F7
MSKAAEKSFSNFIKEHSVIIGILLLALILRCYDLFSIPYTHDELSGLLRTRFDSFSELIAKGVKIDGHPAFVQVFLYYWTGLFGTSEWIVKLPFIFSGVGGVYFAYKIGKRWSNVTVGLIVAAILATSQYPLMYSQIARPYTSGFFFTLWFAWHWGEIVLFKNYARRHLIWFPIAAALCAYNHHFSMLTAGLIGIFGIFYTFRDFLWKYLLLCLSAVVLYSPHFTILAAQLKMGGLAGWLGKPEPSFLPHYIYYIFQFSALVVVLYTGIIAWTIFKGGFPETFGTQSPIKKRRSKAILFAGMLFFATYAVGYFYSIYVAPVLQTSVLIFAYPFLLIFLFGWAKEQTKRMNVTLLLVIMGLNTYVLIFQRQYYTVFYKTPFNQLVLDVINVDKEPGYALIFSDEPKTRFYSERGDFHIPGKVKFFTVPEFTEKDLEKLLEEKSGCEVFYLAATSSLPPNYRAMVLQKFPHIIWQKNYFSASTLCLSKGQPSEKPLADIAKNKDLFNGYNPGKWYDGSYHFEKNEEWGPGYSKELNKLVKRPSDLVDVVVKLKLSDLKQEPLLVLNIQSPDSTIMYRDTPVSRHTVNLKDSTVTLVQSIKFIDLKYRQFEKPTLNTFIWNRDKKPLKILSFQVFYRKDNPLTYALYEPIIN